MILRLLLLVTLTFSFSRQLFAQQITQTIRGTVLDMASSRPLSFASIVLLKTNKKALADSLGNFAIANIPVGRYDLEASIVGYESVIIKEVLVVAAKENYLTISLRQNTQLLKEVIVRPVVNKERALNAAATVSARMLSVEEARRYAGGFDDPARLVSAFAGVSSNINNNSIIVRGNRPQSLQWKLEGVEIPNPNHFADLSAFGGGGLTALSAQLLANSDFFSSAFPAEYNNALSGVFDIFMRKGNNAKQEHTVQLGLTGIDLASEGPFKKGGRSSYLFNYRYSTLALLQSMLPENGDQVKYQDFSFKLNFPTKKAGVFSVWGLGLADRSGQDVKKNQDERKYESDIESEEVKQYMGAIGATHKLFLNDKTYLKTTVAATVSGIDLVTDKLNGASQLVPQNRINTKNWNLVLASFVNTKFNAKHTNKTGITITGLMYDMVLKNVPQQGTQLQTVTNENGSSTLLSAYSNSTVSLGDRLVLNAGVNTQLFTLNNHYTIEPRVGVRYMLQPGQWLSFAYGLHSRLERVNYYFIRNSQYGNGLINKNLDFTKAHHLVAGYDLGINEFMHLKLEVYYQQLFDVPVMKDSSFSLINLKNDWYFNGKLQNTGKGRNYGLDITLDKYMEKGYYFMATASLFNSEYQGDDHVWRNTRYNRNYAFNFLVGKEWQLGGSKQRLFGLNARFSYQGGDRYSPINTAASATAKDVVYDETNAFSKQIKPSFTSHFTISYKINRAKVAHEIAFKLLNATAFREFYEFRYNYLSNAVDEYRESIVIPNLSYRIEF